MRSFRAIQRRTESREEKKSAQVLAAATEYQRLLDRMTPLMEEYVKLERRTFLRERDGRKGAATRSRTQRMMIGHTLIMAGFPTRIAS